MELISETFHQDDKTAFSFRCLSPLASRLLKRLGVKEFITNNEIRLVLKSFGNRWSSLRHVLEAVANVCTFDCL